jgi:hypothetical protein
VFWLQVDPEEVLRFMHCLFLRSDLLPDRRYIDAVASQYLAEVMDQLDLDPSKSRESLTPPRRHAAPPRARWRRSAEPAASKREGLLRDPRDRAPAP